MDGESRSYIELMILGVISVCFFVWTLCSLQNDAQKIQSNISSNSYQLRERIAVIDKILSVNPYAVSKETLAKYDPQYQANFVAEFNPTVALPGSTTQVLTFDQKMAIALREERNEKEEEKEKLNNTSTWSQLPPWRITFLGGLGAFCTCVISLITEQLPAAFKKSPLLTWLGAAVFSVIVIIVFRAT